MAQTTVQKTFLLLTLIGQVEVWIDSLHEELKELKQASKIQGKKPKLEGIHSVLGNNNVAFRLNSIKNNIKGLKDALKERKFDNELNTFLSAGVFKLLEMMVQQDAENLTAINNIAMLMMDEGITHKNIFIFTQPSSMHYATELMRQQDRELHRRKRQELSTPCHHACSPSDWCKGGKCDRNGCFKHSDHNETTA